MPPVIFKGVAVEKPRFSWAVYSRFMAGFAAGFSAAKINALLSQSGPICSCVLIPEETGIAQQIELDMTPSHCGAQKTLGGPPTFVGAFCEIDVVIMCLRDTSERNENPHRLPPPFQQPITVRIILKNVAQVTSCRDQYCSFGWMHILSHKVSPLPSTKHSS